MEALRCVKRRLSDVVYRQLVADMKKASPGGHTEATVVSSAVDPTPTVDSSDQSQPGPDHEPTHPDTDAVDSTPRPVAPAQSLRTRDQRPPAQPDKLDDLAPLFGASKRDLT